MVIAGFTVRELTPVPPGTAVPPQLPVNQSVVKPVPGLVTDIVEVFPEHIDAGLAVIPEGVAGMGFTVTVIFTQFDIQPVAVFLVLA